MLSSRYFGSIAADRTSTRIERGAGQLRIDVNLADPSACAQALIDGVDRAIDELEPREAAARAAIAAVMSDDELQPATFWQFYRDEVDGFGDLARDAFVSTLELVRVGFYPDVVSDTASHIVLDFAVRGPNTDQLLVAKFRADGSLGAIAWES
jgi:hypothetical protein